jgi:hypothetical protein
MRRRCRGRTPGAGRAWRIGLLSFVMCVPWMNDGHGRLVGGSQTRDPAKKGHASARSGSPAALPWRATGDTLVRPLAARFETIKRQARAARPAQPTPADVLVPDTLEGHGRPIVAAAAGRAGSRADHSRLSQPAQPPFPFPFPFRSPNTCSRCNYWRLGSLAPGAVAQDRALPCCAASLRRRRVRLCSHLMHGDRFARSLTVAAGLCAGRVGLSRGCERRAAAALLSWRSWIRRCSLSAVRL